MRPNTTPLQRLIAGKSIRRSRWRWPRGPAGSIGGSKSARNGSAGYAARTANSAGSELWIFDPPKTVMRAEEVQQPDEQDANYYNKALHFNPRARGTRNA
jgi:hypothetical protein